MVEEIFRKCPQGFSGWWTSESLMCNCISAAVESVGCSQKQACSRDDSKGVFHNSYCYRGVRVSRHLFIHLRGIYSLYTYWLCCRKLSPTSADTLMTKVFLQRSLVRERCKSSCKQTPWHRPGILAPLEAEAGGLQFPGLLGLCYTSTGWPT